MHTSFQDFLARNAKNVLPAVNDRVVVQTNLTVGPERLLEMAITLNPAMLEAFDRLKRKITENSATAGQIDKEEIQEDVSSFREQLPGPMKVIILLYAQRAYNPATAIKLAV